MEKKRLAGTAIFTIVGLVALLSFMFGCAMRMEDSPKVYKNDEYGISITGPKGWYMDSKGFRTERLIRLVEFKAPFSASPSIAIQQIDALAKLANVKTPLEYANAHVAELQKNSNNFVLFEGPKEILLNNVPVVKVVYRANLKYEDYYFSKNGSIFCLNIVAWPEEFDKFRKWYDECISTFTLQ